MMEGAGEATPTCRKKGGGLTLGAGRGPREAAHSPAPRDPHEGLAEGTAGDRRVASGCASSATGLHGCQRGRPQGGLALRAARHRSLWSRAHQSLCGARDQPPPRETSRTQGGQADGRVPWGSGASGPRSPVSTATSRSPFPGPGGFASPPTGWWPSALAATFANKRNEAPGRGLTLPALTTGGAARPRCSEATNARTEPSPEAASSRGAQAEPSLRCCPPQQGALATRP